jgi:hypothetical protein
MGAADDAGGTCAAFGDGSFTGAAGSVVSDEDEVGVFLESVFAEGEHEFSHEVIEVFEVATEVGGSAFLGLGGVRSFEVGGVGKD